MEFINLNGKTLDRDKAFIKTDSHSYRYGDGLFETMKVKDERILLKELHFERLFTSLSVLKVSIPNYFATQNLEREIIDLCKKNRCEQHARVRLSVSRGSGGLSDVDENFQWVTECRPLNVEVNKLNEKGLTIDLFPDSRKSCDAFSNLKTASHLAYVMASLYAKENSLDDCLLQNVYGRVCDSTIANVFWVKNRNLLTPPLSEGCIAGVMRRYLIEILTRKGLGTIVEVQEKECEIKDLENADEIFLTNAIQGIRWVKGFRDKIYSNRITQDLVKSIFKN